MKGRFPFPRRFLFSRNGAGNMADRVIHGSTKCGAEENALRNAVGILSPPFISPLKHARVSSSAKNLRNSERKQATLGVPSSVSRRQDGIRL